MCVSQAIFRSRLPWSPSWETSKNILNARFVSIPTTNPELYHVYTHFAVSVWRIMQEPATDEESSVVQSAKRKSICPKEIVSKVCRAVFSTTVCWVSLPFVGVAMEVAWLVPNVGKTTSQMYCRRLRVSCVFLCGFYYKSRHHVKRQWTFSDRLWSTRFYDYHLATTNHIV